MKVSLNWIKQFHAVDLSVDQLVQKIGEQLGAIEEVVSLGKKYQGIVVAKVVATEKLQGSDHLNVCRIDDGGTIADVERTSDGFVQVVCGAPNVRAGLMVAWLPPGTTVPESFDKEPFVLSAREIRGQKSNGMLASAKELALGDNHDGILEIDGDVQPGQDFVSLYELDDTIIDIENKMFTHRPDCFGQLGIAREIAGISGQAFHSPDWYAVSALTAASQNEVLRVEVQIPELCKRYMAVVIEGISVAPSPVWLQTYLARVGIRPINNIVDMTNYLMMLTGQPLHAFDFDKIAEGGTAQIVVRNPHAAETMTLLDGKTITPKPEAILICDQAKPIALGGIMGGNNSEIDEHTTRIVIECANFNMYNIRRTSMEHGIFSDAVTRFTKGQSAEQCPAVLQKAIDMTKQLVPVSQALGSVVDVNHSTQEYEKVQVRAGFINDRLGLELEANAMATLLTNVEFVVSVDSDELTVAAPFWRTDIEIAEDVVEEIGRLQGFDKLPLVLPHRDIAPADQDPLLLLKKHIRASLSAAGANEVLTYSFVHGKLIDSVGQNMSQAFKLSNALSPDLQYYRFHALPSLLDKIHLNIKAGYDEFALYELNKGHNLLHPSDSEGWVPEEYEFLDFVYAYRLSHVGAAYFVARRYLDNLAKDLGLVLSYKEITKDPHVPVAEPYDLTRSAYVSTDGGIFLGMVGELKRSVLDALKLPDQTAAFTIGPSQLLEATTSLTGSYIQLPKYPRVEQDICLRVASSLSYQALHDFVITKLKDLKPADTVYTLSPIDIYSRDDDRAHKQITFRLSIASFNKTMTDHEVNGLLDQIAAAAHAEFEAVRI